MPYQKIFFCLMGLSIFSLSSTTFSQACENTCGAQTFEFKDLLVDESEQAFEQAEAYDLGFDVQQDKARAFLSYMQLAEQGHQGAQLRLGQKYFFGEDVAENLDQAFIWLSRVAEQGQDEAQYLLGLLYQNEKFAQKDGLKAIDWLTRAANQNLHIAQAQLGQSYELGMDIPIDYAKAHYWYQQAVENGYSPATYRLVVLYANGHGVAKDEAKAFDLLNELNQSNNAAISLSLAENYHYGLDGFPIDLIIAKQWYQLLVDQGYSGAKSILKHLK